LTHAGCFVVQPWSQDTPVIQVFDLLPRPASFGFVAFPLHQVFPVQTFTLLWGLPTGEHVSVRPDLLHYVPYSAVDDARFFFFLSLRGDPVPELGFSSKLDQFVRGEHVVQPVLDHLWR
jgi:hypothetical protein